jgi:hypothetical protein
VLYRGSDGALIVGEHAPSGTLDIHLIKLNGTSVASDTTFGLGSVVGFGSVDQMFLLSNTTVLFTIRGVTGSFANGVLWTLDLTTGATTSIPVTGAVGTINALAFDPVNSYAYLGYFASGTSYVYRVSVPAGGAAQLVATVPGDIVQLAMDASGSLYSGSGDPTPNPPDVHRIDVTTGTLTPLYPNAWGGSALAIEEVTGNLVVGTFDLGSNQGAVIVGPPAGPGLIVATAAASPLPNSLPSGIAVNSNMDVYGPATPGANQYWFSTAPNPGGLPIIGNAGFSVTVNASSGSAPGVLGIATLPANSAFAGLTILIDPGTLIVPLIPLSASSSVSVPLAIPNDPFLSGFAAYLQTAHTEAAGLASSAGLRITLP